MNQHASLIRNSTNELEIGNMSYFFKKNLQNIFVKEQ